MRTISAALKSAQEAVSGTPYIKLLFTSKGGGTTNDYSSRVLQLTHIEEPYHDEATIILRNDDLGVADLLGYWTQIGYGFYTGNNVAEPDGDDAGNEYSYSARLWVKNQTNVSMEGQLVSIIYLEGMWEILREQLLLIGNPPFYQDDPYTTSTVYSILESIIETHLSSFTGLTFLLSALGAQDDDIINDYQPQFEFNTPDYENLNDLIHALMDMTKCYLRAKANLTFEVIYPQTSDSADEEYYSDQAHYFYEYAEKTNLLIPNHIILFGNDADDWAEPIQVESEDGAQIDKYMDVTAIYQAGSITNSFDLANRVAAYLTKIKAEILAGRLIIPHDCSMELYDRPKIYNLRGQ